MKYQGLIWKILWYRPEDASKYYYKHGTYKDLPVHLEKAMTFWNAMGRGWPPYRCLLMALFSKGWVIRSK